MERWYRANSGALQQFYDRAPSPVWSALTTVRGWSLARNRYAGANMTLLQQLLAAEKRTAARIEADQLESLRRVLAMAQAHVPYYREYAAPEIRDLRDWQQLPILTRAQAKANWQRLINQSVPARERISVSTTGTTGAALKVFYTPSLMRRNWAFRLQQFHWAGIAPRTPRITLFGNRIVPPQRDKPPFWVQNHAEAQHFLSIFHLSAETAPDYIAFLRRQSGRVVEGFPSVLGILSDFLLQAGQTAPMRAVFCDGEPLHSFLREKIEAAFETRVYDTYGNTELCGLIQQCEHGGMHLNVDYGFLEILDENDRPAPRGETGDFVWTGLINDSMPFIRYRIGDRGAWRLDAECPCGRAYPLVDPGVTRESDLLYAADGRVFSPRSVNQVLKGTSAFRFCQFIQSASGAVKIRAVGSGEAARMDLNKVRQQIAGLLGTDTLLEIELATEPVTLKGGKTPLVIQQRNG